MGITVAIMAQGTMGAGVGKRLHESGADVRTLLVGRSAESAERARAAGMQPMADKTALLDGADFFLSILPPDQAENCSLLDQTILPVLPSQAMKLPMLDSPGGGYIDSVAPT
jgi:3-hydroxyisobutyrate dehydrogenase-like beta-hydroxyacid dehydrogenase